MATKRLSPRCGQPGCILRQYEHVGGKCVDGMKFKHVQSPHRMSVSFSIAEVKVLAAMLSAAQNGHGVSPGVYQTEVFRGVNDKIRGMIKRYRERMANDAR